MPIEIERKFLVNSREWNLTAKGEKAFYQQGYIVMEPEKTVRVRATDTEGFITIKGISVGASRPEYEYRIPKSEALELLERFCTSIITKYRYGVTVGGKLWEVDEFLGANEGLVIAEIELADEEEAFDLPAWVDAEVTSIEKYYNSQLSRMPFKSWQ